MNKENLTFPITEHFPLEDLKKVQLEVLEMGKIVCGILENNDIPYMISHGTLLGAVRHEGFIPWDDDFDIFIFDEVYSLAIDTLEKELPKYLIVHSIKNDPLYFKSWNSIKNINTSAVFRDMGGHIDNDFLKYNCLTLDLFRIKEINASCKHRYQLEEALDFFERKYTLGLIKKDKYLEEINAIKNKLLNIKKICNEIDYQKTDSLFFIRTMSCPVSIKDTYPLKKYNFSGNFFYGPNNPDAYLKSKYGDYLSIPEYEDRKSHYKKVVFLK